MQYQSLLKVICEDKDIKTMLDIYVNRKRTKACIDNQKNLDDIDASGADDYLAHCVRSYMLGFFIKNEMSITLINQKTVDPSFAPMSRLTDAIFLNIKKTFTTNEINYKEELFKIYGIRI